MIVFWPLNGKLLFALAYACLLRLSLDRLSNALVTLLPMTLLGIICRLVKQSQQLLKVHDWVVYKFGALLGSVGHRVKIHNITPATGKERGDLEIDKT